MGARNRAGIGLSYRAARLHRLAEWIPLESIIGLLKILALIGVLLQVCAGQQTNSWGGLSAGQEEDRSGLGGGANITAVWVGGHRLNSVADPDPGYDAFLTPGFGIRDEQSA